MAPMAALSQDELKQQAAWKAVDYVKSGMVVGLGTGSTAAFAVDRIGQLMKEGTLKDIVGVPTSIRTYEQAKSLGIPLATLDEQPKIDVAIDGADEVDPNLDVVKGRGGALLREKMVEMASAKFVCIVDDTKLVEGLGGSKLAMPVEIVQFCHKYTLNRCVAAAVHAVGRLALLGAAARQGCNTTPAAVGCSWLSQQAKHGSQLVSSRDFWLDFWLQAVLVLYVCAACFTTPTFSQLQHAQANSQQSGMQQRHTTHWKSGSGTGYSMMRGVARSSEWHCCDSIPPCRLHWQQQCSLGNNLHQHICALQALLLRPLSSFVKPSAGLASVHVQTLLLQPVSLTTPSYVYVRAALCPQVGCLA